jgi:hypothetical protein
VTVLSGDTRVNVDRPAPGVLSVTKLTAAP